MYQQRKTLILIACLLLTAAYLVDRRNRQQMRLFDQTGSVIKSLRSQ